MNARRGASPAYKSEEHDTPVGVTPLFRGIGTGNPPS
jgi:hypothetical protein